MNSVTREITYYVYYGYAYYSYILPTRNVLTYITYFINYYNGIARMDGMKKKRFSRFPSPTISQLTVAVF